MFSEKTSEELFNESIQTRKVLFEKSVFYVEVDFFDGEQIILKVREGDFADFDEEAFVSSSLKEQCLKHGFYIIVGGFYKGSCVLKLPSAKIIKYNKEYKTT